MPTDLSDLVNEITESLNLISTEEYQDMYDTIKAIENREPRMKPPKSFALCNLEELIIALIEKITDNDTEYTKLKDITNKEIDRIFNRIHKQLLRK